MTKSARIKNKLASLEKIIEETSNVICWLVEDKELRIKIGEQLNKMRLNNLMPRNIFKQQMTITIKF